MNNSTQHYGIELDALPYLTGGYYLSAWLAQEHLRYRAVIANATVPDFATKSGFEDNEINAYALILDYFPDSNMTGIWYGGGLEYWDSSIKEENGPGYAEYTNTVATAGMGYVWYFSKQWYLNPWGALHLLIGGDKDIDVGTKRYEQSAVTAEVSIKVGWVF